MTTQPQTRASARAVAGAVAVGAAFVVVIGGAYASGTMVKSASVRAKGERLATAADAGFSTRAVLDAAAGGMDESALAIAERHDPYMIAGSAQRDRQAALFAQRLENSKKSDSVRAGLRTASLTAAPSARPFRLGNALDASRDLDCLTQAVYYEARGEGQAGMQAVAQVVLNRVRHPAFPKSVCAVVFQGAARGKGCQFSFACDGSMRRNVGGPVWERARKVASQALSGQVMSAVGTATHFHTTRVNPRWSNTLLRVTQVGTHVFYRFGGRNGGTNAFRYEPKPSTEVESFTPVYASFAPVSGGDSAPPPYAILFNGGKDEAKAEAAAAAPAAPAPAKEAAAAPVAAPAAPAKTDAAAPAA